MSSSGRAATQRSTAPQVVGQRQSEEVRFGFDERVGQIAESELPSAMQRRGAAEQTIRRRVGGSSRLPARGGEVRELM
jgi:hypothetical protein